MNKKLTAFLVTFLCSLFISAQPLVRPIPPHGNHHTQRLPGVNERRLARLEKMRQANIALRHQHGPLRAQTQPQTKRGLVLLVQFSDVKLKDDAPAQWGNRFNQQGFSLNNHVGSVRDYFLEQSYGLLNIDFDVVGPLTVSETRTYYGTAPNNRLDDRAPEMVIEALKLADSLVNYADYDWDGDKWVDQVYVIYAGETKSQTQGYIWPHEWSLYTAKYFGCGSGYQTMDGVSIDTYAVSNELAGTNLLQGIGTACHEFSHCLGYPDFYDTGYTGGTAGQYWDVLDGGCYNGPRGIGEIPSPYTAYERWSAGWIDLIPLTKACKVKDMPAINEEGVAYVIKNTGNSNEYYILENRQKVSFGTGNGGHGLMVWHIDYSKTAWQDNCVNTNKDHQRMTFLPADGKVGDLAGSESEGYYYNVSAADEAGDPYPGTKKVKSVQQLTWFTAERGGTKIHGNLIHDISETSDGKITFIYGDYVALPTPEPAMPTDITETSFTANWQPVEGATSYTLQVEAMTGEEAPATVLLEDFSGFSNAGADAAITNSVIDMYTREQGWELSNLYGTREASARVGTAGASGYIITPAIGNRPGTLIVEFDAKDYGDGSSVVVSVFKGDQVFASETIPLSDSRATYSRTFEDIPSGCNVKIASSGRRKRFYIYNVNIMDMSGTDVESFTISGLATTSYTIDASEAEMYYYRVQAVCEDGTSEWSDWMDVDIAAPIGKMPEDKDRDGGFFDLSGRRLQHVPQRGIYVHGGKTHLAR